MTDWFIPRQPENLRGDFGGIVEHDVYHIAERMKELSPNLLLRDRARGGGWTSPMNGKRWIISEISIDGVERWVMGRQDLDARIIEDLEYMLHVPYEKRFAEAERLEAQIMKQNHEDELDELYEHMGAPMLPLLERTGFTQRGLSYPKRGAVGGKGSRRKS